MFYHTAMQQNSYSQGKYNNNNGYVFKKCIPD